RTDEVPQPVEDPENGGAVFVPPVLHLGELVADFVEEPLDLVQEFVAVLIPPVLDGLEGVDDALLDLRPLVLGPRPDVLERRFERRVGKEVYMDGVSSSP